MALRLLVVENSRLPILSYYTFYDVGGRFESRERGTTGATHFLEHMMFKGAKKYGLEKLRKSLKAMGGIITPTRLLIQRFIMSLFHLRF